MRKRRMHFPPLIFITDQHRCSNPEIIASNLPRGSAVLLRDYGLSDRKLLGQRLRRVCRDNNLIFLVAGNGPLAITLSADGIHFREAQIPQVRSWRIRHPNWLVTVSTHSEESIRKAARGGADAALISPIFPSDSHPTAKPLGVTKLSHLISSVPIPLYALGGITPKNQARLTNLSLLGIAGISGFA